MTWEEAQKFCAIPASPTERERSAGRLKYIENAILGGRAIIFDWATAEIEESGETIRINGQHSSYVAAQMGEDIPAGLMVHRSHYKVPNKESAALLFRQIDGRQSARSIADIAGVYQGLEPDLMGVDKKAGRAAIEAICWFNQKVVGLDVPAGDDKFDLFTHRPYHPFILMCGRILKVGKTGEFSLPVIGAMFGTHEREPDVAEEFWTSVAKQGDSTTLGDPAATLDAWLVGANMRKGKTKDEIPSQLEVYNACVRAWNAHRNRKTFGAVPKYVAGKGVPDIE